MLFLDVDADACKGHNGDRMREFHMAGEDLHGKRNLL